MNILVVSQFFPPEMGAPGGRFYDRTNAQRFYATAEAAVADGYRQSKS